MRRLKHLLYLLCVVALGDSEPSSSSTQSHPQRASVPCLFANDQPYEFDVRTCRADPMRISQKENIRAAIKSLAPGNVSLIFLGCAGAPFSTRPGEADASYTIYYPILPRSAPDDYVAPLIHELSHVYQLQLSGSYAKLTHSYSMRRIELGADYLTGVVIRNYLNSSNPTQFEHNLQLVGKYRETDTEAHGRPEQRVAAFRYGFHLPFEEFKQDLRLANREFQRNRYGDLEDF